MGFWSGFPAYYFIISLSSMVSLFWFYKRCDKKGLSTSQAMDLAAVCLVSGFIGARLSYWALEQPVYYWRNPLSLFYFWQGGFIFYGGGLGSLLSCLCFIRVKKINFWIWADRAAPAIALSYALGRLACFVQGCCYGQPCSWSWGVHKHGDPESLFRHPTQLYSTSLELINLGVLLFLERKRRPPGQVFLIWVFLHAGARLFVELFRGDPRGPFFLKYSIGFWMSLVFMIFAVGFLRYGRFSKPTNRGLRG